MTGSLVSFAPLDCLNDHCAAECASGWLFGCTDCVCFAHYEIFIWVCRKRRFPSRVVGTQRAVSTCGLSSHGVASAGSGDDAGRRQQTFRKTKPSPCVYCGRVIKCDMYRHVAKFHLDMFQLWRCPVSWCTVWKGNPQDCIDHVRAAHDVPWIVKTANMEQFVPPWTVHRQVWSESLKVAHSGISTDILLFSWNISTGSITILPSGRTCLSYGLCCRCRWFCLWILRRRQLR